jgi:tight adherence protein B
VTVVAGLVLGAGLVLVVSPWLWPRVVGTHGRGFADRLRERLTQAGLARVPVAVFVVVSVLLGVAVAALVVSVVPVVALGVAAGVVGAFAPAVMIGGRARRRRRALRSAWPDLVDHLVAGVRAGQSLNDAVTSLGAVGPTEIRGAFRAFGRTVEATGTLGGALDDLKVELADPVADRIVETLRMSREVGGTELPSILRALAASLRQEAAVRSEVEARQSWVLNAARLGVASPWIVLLMLASRGEAAAAYDSPAGVTLLVVGFAVTVVAYRLMVALGRLPEERRWFA